MLKYSICLYICVFIAAGTGTVNLELEPELNTTIGLYKQGKEQRKKRELSQRNIIFFNQRKRDMNRKIVKKRTHK